MKIAIFGATGGVGLHLLSQLVSKGYTLTALSRSKEKITNLNLDIRIIEGDVTNPTAVSEAIVGQDIVICLLGAPLLDNSKIRTRGTKVIVKAMQEAGVKKIICLSSFGVGSSHKYLPWLYKIVLVPLLLKRAFQDHKNQEDILQNSDLDWIIIRPGNFSDGPLTKKYQHGRTEAANDQKLALKISRADVADFISNHITSNAYLRDATWISY